MKRALFAVCFAVLGAGCGLDTAGLEDLSHQPGSTGSQHAGADASLPTPLPAPLAVDAQADTAIATEAGAPGCGASTCGAGAVCCAEDLGGGKTATSCVKDCKGDGLVLCDLGGAPCAEGHCGTTEKFPGLSVCD